MTVMNNLGDDHPLTCALGVGFVFNGRRLLGAVQEMPEKGEYLGFWIKDEGGVLCFSYDYGSLRVVLFSDHSELEVFGPEGNEKVVYISSDSIDDDDDVVVLLRDD